MSDKPKWWPECPYPESIFSATEDDYVAAIPDENKRTAISGFLGRSFWNIASKSIWNAMQKNIGSDELMMSAILEAIDDALDGNEPSDFMMSFPIVRKAWEVSQK